MRKETQGENGIVSNGIIYNVFQCIKRASDISLFLLVHRVTWGRLYSHLAKRGRTGAKSYWERRSRSDRSGSWSLRR